MVLTKDFTFPPDEELTGPELNVTASALATGAFHLGIYCEEPCKEFMLCRDELNDPRKCMKEGRQVTDCGIEFFKKVKKSCLTEFVDYQRCLIRGSEDYDYGPCRNFQDVFNNCVKKHIGVERPRPFYFCEPRIHDSKRPKPDTIFYPKFDDATPGLTEEVLKEQKTNFSDQGMFDGSWHGY